MHHHPYVVLGECRGGLGPSRAAPWHTTPTRIGAWMAGGCFRLLRRMRVTTHAEGTRREVEGAARFKWTRSLARRVQCAVGEALVAPLVHAMSEGGRFDLSASRVRQCIISRPRGRTKWRVDHSGSRMQSLTISASRILRWLQLLRRLRGRQRAGGRAEETRFLEFRARVRLDRDGAGPPCGNGGRRRARRLPCGRGRVACVRERAPDRRGARSRHRSAC